MLTRVSVPVFTTTSWTTDAAKLGRRNETSHRPSASPPMRYPAAVESAAETTPPPSGRASTRTPGSGAPVGSRTIPTTAPVAVCGERPAHPR